MIWICHLSNFISWNVGDFTWPGVVEFLWTAKLKKGIKNLSSVPVNVVKRPLGLIFHVVVVQLSLMDRAEFSFLVVNPAVVFTFSLPLCTLFCFCSLVTFRKCRVALPMATLHSCKLSWRWTLLRLNLYYYSFISIWVACSRPVDSHNLQNFNHRLLLVLKYMYAHGF